MCHCYSVAEIQEWGKLISGSKVSHLKKDNAGITDYQQIIALW